MKDSSLRGFLTNVALIKNNVRLTKATYADAMKISDCVCPSCGSSYLVAESTSASASPSHADCAICGERLASCQAPQVTVYPLQMSPEFQYPPPQPPPSPH